MKRYLVLAVDGVADTRPLGPVIAPARTPLPVRTVPGHVACIAADSADDAGRVVRLIGTIVLAMSDAATVLAGLVLVIS